MTACPQFVFCLTWLILGEMAQVAALKFAPVRQGSDFVSAETGQDLTLPCFYDDDGVATRFYWYKQTVGREPRLVSTLYKYESSGTFQEEFNNNPRFTLDTGKGKNHLMIRDLQISDSATYFCASSYLYRFEMADGATVSVKGSGLIIPALIHQSVSGTVQPGDSGTLDCSVHTGTSDDEHSVYWFRNSRESPQLLYTDGNTGTKTCFYNLPTKTLNLSHAGTSYCAAISCGHVLFGNRVELDSKNWRDSRVSVYFLSGALALTSTLSVLLTFLLCWSNDRIGCRHTEDNSRFSTPSTTNAELPHDEENIHYAALQKHDVYRSRRERKILDSECVYSSIKQ